ncbi:hypothetical protein Tco_1290110, partial [Tanacetum coccineum]
ALRNKAIMEGFIIEDDDEPRYEQKRRWNIYTNYDDAYEINHGDNDDLVKEISMNIGGEFINLEILKCWSLEIQGGRQRKPQDFFQSDGQRPCLPTADKWTLRSLARRASLYSRTRLGWYGKQFFLHLPPPFVFGGTVWAWPLFFCLTGVVISCIPSLCLTSILGTPLMLPPIIMVCSGHSGLIATFIFSTGSGVGASAWLTIWISSDLALSVMIVSTPALVRNFIIPCAVDGTAPSTRIPGLPRIPLY